MSFDPLADLMNGLNTNAEGTRSRKRPCAGRGVYLLENYTLKPTTDGPPILTATLRIAQPAPGSSKKPGDVVELAWFISKSAKEGGENEKARARDFVNALIGASPGVPAGENSLKLAQPTQPGTGIAIIVNAVYGTYTRKKAGKHSGQEVGTVAESVEYTYENVPGQTGEQIASNRAALANLATAQTYQAPVAPPTAPVAPAVLQVAAPAAPPAGSPLAFLFK